MQKIILIILGSIYINAIDFSKIENKFIGVGTSTLKGVSFGFDIDKKTT